VVQTHNLRASIFPCWLQLTAFSGKSCQKAPEGIVFAAEHAGDVFPDDDRFSSPRSRRFASIALANST
jgi:hypothetical protein